MDDGKTLDELIQIALNELEKLSVKYSMYKKGSMAYENTYKVLMLLKSEINNNEQRSIDKRVLRAMHDIGMASYKVFENTKMEIAIDNITSILYDTIPIYKKLEPLRGDFGKGDPI